MSRDVLRPSDNQPLTARLLDVEVARHEGGWTERGINDATLELAAHAALAATTAVESAHYEMSILLTNDAEIRELNRAWREKDRPTNVLSFPTGNVPGGTHSVTAQPPQGGGILLGDIVIALETTAAEASDKGITLSDHVSHLVVHGALHLLGFDHLDETQATRMEDLERHALASLGIADPYADDALEVETNTELAEITK